MSSESLVLSPRRLPADKIRRRFWQYLVLTLVSLIIIVPIIMLIFGGLKTRGELASYPYTPPWPPRWENYALILSKPIFWSMLRNSLVVMILTTIGVVLISSLAAFAFARLRFRHRSLMFNLFTLGLLFPMSIAILPEYLLLRQLGLLNNLMGVVLPQIAFGLAGNILILRNFFLSVPMELQDAAAVDGCSPLRFFWSILLPLQRPALAAVAILTMITSWNELFLPLVVLDSEHLWTLPMGTMQFVGQYVSDWSLVLAFVTLTMVPVVIFYLVAERQIVSGLTAGAIKG